MKLKNKVAVITGAGSGFGRAIALSLAREGAKIGVNDINEESIENTLGAVSQVGGEGLALPGDVGDSSQVRDMFKTVSEKWETVHILVNNAGIAIKGAWDDYLDRFNKSSLKSVEDIITTGKSQESMKITSQFKDEWWDETLRVHLNGTFYCSREALKLMESKGGGKIINMASYCGEGGHAGLPAYSAAKGGIIGFTKALAKEVIGSGIIVNAIAPGFCGTPLLAPFDEKLMPLVLAATPAGRLGTPEEIAGLVCYLASDEADFIVGQVISPNGGIRI